MKTCGDCASLCDYCQPASKKEKRSYWLRGKIFKYAKYKAYNEGIVTCRVNPRNTSRECARCSALVARYDAGQKAVGYTPGASLVFCSNCQMRGNADRNASIVVGKRLLARYQKQVEEAPSLKGKGVGQYGYPTRPGSQCKLRNAIIYK